MAKSSTIHPPESTLEEDILRARTRALRRRAEEPFAVRATYDPEYQRVEVELNNGFWFAFPPGLFSDLGKASPDELSEIIIDPSGYALHWPRLDSDYDVAGIVQIALGAKQWLSISELGRLGGKATSEAKRAAAIANGLKGGRPSKRKPDRTEQLALLKKRRAKNRKDK